MKEIEEVLLKAYQRFSLSYPLHLFKEGTLHRKIRDEMWMKRFETIKRRFETAKRQEETIKRQEEERRIV